MRSVRYSRRIVLAVLLFFAAAGFKSYAAGGSYRYNCRSILGDVAIIVLKRSSGDVRTQGMLALRDRYQTLSDGTRWYPLVLDPERRRIDGAKLGVVYRVDWAKLGNSESVKPEYDLEVYMPTRAAKQNPRSAVDVELVAVQGESGSGMRLFFKYTSPVSIGFDDYRILSEGRPDFSWATRYKPGAR